jgi:hypothetical protein
MKRNIKLAITTLFIANIVAVPTITRAADTNAPAMGETKKSNHGVSSGKVSALDATAKTLTVGKHTFDITADTKINKNGQPAALSDIAVGDKVGIAYKKMDDGKVVAITINDGKKSQDDTKK